MISKLSNEGPGNANVDDLERKLESLNGEINVIEGSLNDIRKSREEALKVLEEYEDKLRSIKKIREETRGAIEKAKSAGKE